MRQGNSLLINWFRVALLPEQARYSPLLNYQGGDSEMPKYLIEREIPGAGNMTPPQLQAVSQTSCGVLQKLGSQIQWLHSYVTGDKIYCVYIASNEDMVREHARQGRFPANRISEIKTMIDPTTAEERLQSASS
jgi:hypothetical protein